MERRQGILIGESNAPGNIGKFPVTAAREKTSPAAYTLAQRQGRRQEVGNGPNRELIFFEIKDCDQNSANKSSVKHQTSLPDLEHVQGGVSKMLNIDHHVEETGPHNGGDEDIKTEVNYLLGIISLFFCSGSGERNPDEKG